MMVTKFPEMHKILLSKGIVSHISLDEINAVLTGGLNKQLAGKDMVGKNVAILIGSRGIYNLQSIVKTVVRHLQRSGANVVILPAMGSHGGATAEGQRSILERLHITQPEVGAPILSQMDVKVIDNVDGHPVYVDRAVLDFDWIIPINRVKAHTDFHGPYESGIVKMLVVGLGKRAQAEVIHKHGIHGLKNVVPQVAKKVLEHVSMLAAVAIVENQCDETGLVEILDVNNLFEREKELLILSKKMLPALPVRNLDVLVVSQMGKNISGVGMDPNITGRMRIKGIADDTGTAKRIVALDLTKESEGNALGMGIADIITRRLYDKIDIQKTYINTITSGFLERSFIPVVVATDEEAVRIALETCGRVVSSNTARVAVIHNTLDLAEIYVSETLLNEISPNYELSPQKSQPMFNENGNMMLGFPVICIDDETRAC